MDNSETRTKAVRTVIREWLKRKTTKTIPVSGSVTTIIITVLKLPQNEGTLTDIQNSIRCSVVTCIISYLEITMSKLSSF